MKLCSYPRCRWQLVETISIYCLRLLVFTFANSNELNIRTSTALEKEDTAPWRSSLNCLSIPRSRG